MDRIMIGNRLKELIEGDGISIKELEKQLGVHYDTIMKWFKGKAIPSHKTLIRLSEILNVSIDYILRGENNSQNSFDLKDSTTKLMTEQINFYKDKSVFFEKRSEERKRIYFSGKRKNDPKNLNVKKMRKMSIIEM